MTFSVRTAAPEELLTDRAYQAYKDCMFAPTMERYRRKMSGYLSRGCRVRVCETGGVLVGIAVTAPEENGSAELVGIAVEGAFRGQGIGRALLTDAIRQAGASRLFAETDEDAVGFYRHCGMTARRFTEIYAGVPVTRYRCEMPDDPSPTGEIRIRRVRPGDEAALARIQTESWRSAFSHILDGETLAQHTDLCRAEAMYRSLLGNHTGNGYLLTLDGAPHCIAWWDRARDEAFAGKAELICIHSLPQNRRKGCGRQMMARVLADIREAGFTEVVLWVFRANTAARAFYKSLGFRVSEITKNTLGAEEICYRKQL